MLDSIGIEKGKSAMADEISHVHYRIQIESEIIGVAVADLQGQSDPAG